MEDVWLQFRLEHRCLCDVCIIATHCTHHHSSQGHPNALPKAVCCRSPTGQAQQGVSILKIH